MKTTQKKLLRLAKLATDSLSKLSATTTVEISFNNISGYTKVYIHYFTDKRNSYITLYQNIPYEENLDRLFEAVKAIEKNSIKEFKLIQNKQEGK